MHIDFLIFKSFRIEIYKSDKDEFKLFIGWLGWVFNWDKNRYLKV